MLNRQTKSQEMQKPRMIILIATMIWMSGRSQERTLTVQGYIASYGRIHQLNPGSRLKSRAVLLIRQAISLNSIKKRGGGYCFQRRYFHSCGIQESYLTR